MITLQTMQYVPGLTAHAAYEFLVDFGDEEYQNWWPGMHFQAKPLRRFPGRIGNLTHVRQQIGPYRVTTFEETAALVPDKRIEVRLRRLGGLPIKMSYEFAEDAGGTTVTFTLTAGFTGPLRVLNPLFRVYFTPHYAAALDEHLKEEFLRLGEQATAVVKKRFGEERRIS